MSSSEAESRAPVRHVRPALFVLSSPQDREWVEGFLRPELGLAPGDLLTEESFRPGVATVDEVGRAVRQARYTLLVLSPAFLADQWATFGGTLATHAGVTDPGRVIPLLVEPCDLPLTITYRVRLDCTDPERWGAEIARLRELLSVAEPPAERMACPYPGLVAYGSEDAPFFYGRDREIDDLTRRLRLQNFLLVAGPSGSGKSSLITAGLLPRLADEFHIRTMRPGERPYEALQSTLESDGAGRRLLVIDPLEEVFTQATPGERERFLRALAVLRDSGDCALVLLMRATNYAELMESPLWPLGPGERVEIVPLRDAELRQAIAQPARDVGVQLEPVLIERLMHDAAGEPGVLPLLQETMVLLWERRSRRLLTARAYATLGTEGRSGLATAMATRADAALAALPPARQAIARRILLRLVHLSDDHGDSRRRQPVTALRTGSDGDDFDHTLRHLADQRLVIVSGDDGDSEGRFADLAHEQLIRGWPTLRDWVEQHRSDELARRRIGHDAGEWAGSGRELYRGRRLAAALEWRRRYPHELGPDELRFLRAGRFARTARRTALTLLVLAFLAGTAWLAVPPTQEWRWREEARSLGPTVLLPGGVALVGPKPSPVTLPALRFDRHEVTNAQFRLCVRARQCLEPVQPYDESLYYQGNGDQPVVFVTAYQAAGYCAWAGRRLPTEVEWERAARGTTGRPYPWGSAKPDATRVNAVLGDAEPEGLATVTDGRYRAGETPEGITHLSGDVREWVRTRVRFDESLDERTTDQLRRLGEWNGRDRIDTLAVKGGGWMEAVFPVALANSADATTLDVQTGFRCVS